MGDVWVAYHPGLKRDVAVKILRPEMQERSGSALARFEREVRATAELEHPNTVRVFDYGTTEDGLWYYVMELLQGETLAAHVMRLGPLSPARAVHVVGQAARALGEAHERGIVHRDVKPENLFLTSLGGEHDFVKVIDFGIAKVSSGDRYHDRHGMRARHARVHLARGGHGPAKPTPAPTSTHSARVLYFSSAGALPSRPTTPGLSFSLTCTSAPRRPRASSGGRFPPTSRAS